MTSNVPKWSERFEYVTPGKAPIDELGKIDNSRLSNDEVWDLARLNEELISTESAFGFYKHYETREPEDPDVAYKLGQFYFEQSEQSCLSYFKKALERPALAIECCRYAYHYLVERDRKEDTQ